MADEADWKAATWDGNRRRQHAEFLALPLREKLRRLEELAEVSRFFEERWRMRKGATDREGDSRSD